MHGLESFLLTSAPSLWAELTSATRRFANPNNAFLGAIACPTTTRPTDEAYVDAGKASSASRRRRAGWPASLASARVRITTVYLSLSSALSPQSLMAEDHVQVRCSFFADKIGEGRAPPAAAVCDINQRDETRIIFAECRTQDA
jgi:hypothetical protein